jgi:NAD(P)-dependent dehydrogenase (short-subunit alcohol dehydrogenase family)
MDDKIDPGTLHDQFWAGRYADQTVLVTGGAGSIGTATATRLAREGATIGVVDIREDATDTLVAALQAAGHEAYGYPIDAADPKEVKKAFDAFEQETGKIDALVNLAGDYPVHPWDDITLEVWRSDIKTNLDTAFVCSHDVMPRMIKNGYGRISTTSSGTVHVGLVEYPAYIAAKIGVIGLARVLARRGGPHGVTANAVMPTATDSWHNRELLGENYAEMYQHVVDTQSVPRVCHPDDIAEGIAWVCSRQASFYTGQLLYIGGGDYFTD